MSPRHTPSPQPLNPQCMKGPSQWDKATTGQWTPHHSLDMSSWSSFFTQLSSKLDDSKPSSNSCSPLNSKPQSFLIPFSFYFGGYMCWYSYKMQNEKYIKVLFVRAHVGAQNKKLLTHWFRRKPIYICYVQMTLSQHFFLLTITHKRYEMKQLINYFILFYFYHEATKRLHI
jgi:hypothetical protein